MYRVGGKGLSEWRWWGSLEGGLGPSVKSAGWATEGRWREKSPMMMQPQRCALMPEKVGHRHRIGLGMKSVQVQGNCLFWTHFHCSVPFKKII